MAAPAEGLTMPATRSFNPICPTGAVVDIDKTNSISILHHLLGPRGTKTGYLQSVRYQSQSEQSDTILCPSWVLLFV